MNYEIKRSYPRDRVIDIIKGIAIIFMVFGHTKTEMLSHVVSFVTMFHMNIFFISSGYTYKEKYAESVKNFFVFLKKKICTIYIPFVLYNLIYILLHNCLVSINVYTVNPKIVDLGFSVSLYYTAKDILWETIKTLCFVRSEELTGGFWFLTVLFCINIMYCFAELIYNKLRSKINFEKFTVFKFQGIVSVVMLLIGYGFSLLKFNKFYIGTIFSAYCLIYIGDLLERKQIMKKIPIYFLPISFVILELINLSPLKISIGGNLLHNPIAFLIVTFCSWILLYQTFALLLKYVYRFAHFIEFIGRHTLSILGLHFLSFKLVNLICALIYEYPLYTVAAFPALQTDKFWWIAYLLVGIFIPVGFAILAGKSKKHIASKFKKG